MRLESDRLAAQLEDMGYDVRVTDPDTRANYGSVQAVAVDWNTRTLSSYADPRRSAGYVIQDATPN